MSYIPHTSEDIALMLEAIGEKSLEHLFDEIPSDLRCEAFKSIPNGLSEMSMLAEAKALSAQNDNGVCFIGAGSYDHHIPAAVWDIASRGEFLTAYTPYQAEASQGTLQLLYEFQTMIAELTGMDVANASLYDGATALAEAILMAARIQREHTTHQILIPQAIHPFYRQTVETIVSNQSIQVLTVPFDIHSGIISPKACQHFQEKPITALVIAQPNFFGCLEEVDALTDWAHAQGALVIACVNPVSLGLLKPPSEWGQCGADIVCGEGQPLGAPMASGGPYFGFFSTRLPYVRHMPGRIVGQTLDKEGKTGYTLTLQAREQHIRRGKATSNICTNQGLLVTAAAIHMSLLGAEGLMAAAKASHQNTQNLVKALQKIPGITPVFSAPTFHEVLLRTTKPVQWVLSELQKQGIAGGYAVGCHYPALQDTFLICATEKRSESEINQYVTAMQAIILNSAVES